MYGLKQSAVSDNNATKIDYIMFRYHLKNQILYPGSKFLKGLT